MIFHIELSGMISELDNELSEIIAETEKKVRRLTFLNSYRNKHLET
jgi:hypothetical protein